MLASHKTINWISTLPSGQTDGVGANNRVGSGALQEGVAVTAAGGRGEELGGAGGGEAGTDEEEVFHQHVGGFKGGVGGLGRRAEVLSKLC